MMELGCEQLIAMGKDIPTPFLLKVSTDRGEESVRVSDILRNIPGERITAIATWKESSIIVKLFLQGARNKRFLFNELRAADLLRQRQIPTPDILHHSNTIDGRGTVLFIDLLEGAENLEQLFHHARSESEQGAVMQMAMQALSRCHEAGIWQNGFDLAQLLLAKDRVYVLSSSALQVQNESLSQDQRIELLAEFLAQLPAPCDDKLPALCEFYQGTSFTQEPIDPEFLRPLVNAKRNNRINHLAKGTFHNQEKVFQIEQSNYLVVYQHNFPRKLVEQFEINPDALVAQGKLIKDGDSTTVVEIKLMDKRYVLKRYNRKSFVHGLTRMLRPTRANNCWRMARVLRALGISTPEPILFMEKRLLWSLRGDSYLLTDFVDADHLLKQLETNIELRQNAEVLVTKFQELFRIMSDYQVSHGDMKATNFIYSNGELIAIDLDAAKRHSSSNSFRSAFRKDWRRFMRNWENSSLASKFRTIEHSLDLGAEA